MWLHGWIFNIGPSDRELSGEKETHFIFIIQQFVIEEGESKNP